MTVHRDIAAAPAVNHLGEDLVAALDRLTKAVEKVADALAGEPPAKPQAVPRVPSPWEQRERQAAA